MTDVRQEFGLRLVGGLCVFFSALTGGNIDVAADHTTGRNRGGANFQNGAVRPAPLVFRRSATGAVNFWLELRGQVGSQVTELSLLRLVGDNLLRRGIGADELGR